MVDNLFVRARTDAQVGEVNRAYGADARVAGLDRQGRAGVETAQERS